MSNIGNVGAGTGAAYTSPNAATAQNTVAETNKDETLPVDTVELGKSAQNSTAGKIYKPDMKTINQLKDVANKNLDTLKQMVDKLLNSQSYTAAGSWTESYEEILSMQKGDMSVFYQSSSTKTFNFSLNVNSADDVQKQAEELIGEDGPLGVKAVSKNILDFAKAISGGDPAKIDTLKKAVQKGFDEVSALFGGWDKLPDITHDTYDAVMAGFDSWKNGGAAAEE